MSEDASLEIAIDLRLDVLKEQDVLLSQIAQLITDAISEQYGEFIDGILPTVVHRAEDGTITSTTIY